MANVVELLPKEYGYVVIILVLYCFLNLYMAVQVGKASKKNSSWYKVFHPTIYPSESKNKDAKLFNCIQRASKFPGIDANVLLLMTLGGLKHPYICSALRVVQSIFLFCWLFHRRATEPAQDRDVFDGSFLSSIHLRISFGFSLLLQPASP